MKKSLPHLFVAALCALAFCLATTTSFAQAKEEKGPSKADLKRYDANKDGQLDDAETATMNADKEARRAAARQARLEKYDTNKDGKISREEAAVEKADKEAAKKEKAEKKSERAKEKSNPKSN